MIYWDKRGIEVISFREAVQILSNPDLDGILSYGFSVSSEGFEDEYVYLMGLEYLDIYSIPFDSAAIFISKKRRGRAQRKLLINFDKIDEMTPVSL